MAQGSIAVDRMKGPLKRKGLVRACPFVERNRRHHRFEVEIAGRRPERLEPLREIRRDVGLSASHGVPDDDLLRCKRKIHRYGRDRLNTERLELERAVL